eukprot:3521747-Rhodomonas_salina.1
MKSPGLNKVERLPGPQPCYLQRHAQAFPQLRPHRHREHLGLDVRCRFWQVRSLDRARQGRGRGARARRHGGGDVSADRRASVGDGASQGGCERAADHEGKDRRLFADAARVPRALGRVHGVE